MFRWNSSLEFFKNKNILDLKQDKHSINISKATCYGNVLIMKIRFGLKEKCIISILTTSLAFLIALSERVWF